MSPADVPTVALLEAEAFPNPWKAATFERVLGQPGAELWVLERAPDGVVAYAVLWCVLEQAELANIAVAPHARGEGVGGRLLDHLTDVARERGVRRIFLEVRPSNRVAAKLYESRGFTELGIRRDYYENPPEDARVLVLELE